MQPFSEEHASQDEDATAQALIAEKCAGKGGALLAHNDPTGRGRMSLSRFRPRVNPIKHQDRSPGRRETTRRTCSIEWVYQKE